MYRIFFDSNAGTAKEGFILWFDASQRDIEKIDEQDRDGANIILYMPDELEIQAVLKYDSCLDVWRGFPLTELSE